MTINVLIKDNAEFFNSGDKYKKKKILQKIKIKINKLV